MKIVDLIQGSPEWLEYRSDRIMATDASVILGVNPFMDAFTLWEQKLGFADPSPENDSMRRGRLLEEEARQLFIKLTGIEMKPVVCESSERPWQAASLDGLSTCRKYILEIKSPKEDTHRFACIEGGVPVYYIAQMQHQLCVTGAEKAYYFSYRPEADQTYAIVEVFPDQEKIEYLCEKEADFYDCLCTFRMPERPWVLQENCVF